MFSIIIFNLILGLIIGCILESGYRSFYAKKIILPKLANVQMYGFIGIFLSILYLAKVSLKTELLLLFVFPTLIEFITGYLYLKIKKVRLWDYSNENLNFMGIIRLRFSIYWFLICSLYYFYLLPILVNKFPS